MKGNVDSNLIFENLDFEVILWKQIDRIGAASDTFESWKANIITLESFLTPYADEDYENNAEKLRRNYKENKVEMYRLILKELLKLMERNNLLLTHQGQQVMERFDDE